ncbi:MAG: PHB depolymerase family esterase [Byssovorax sp.]
MRSLIVALGAASSIALAATTARAEPAGPAIEVEGWPCKGCVTFAPTRDGSARPLLIALHGDDGGTGKLFRALRPACERERVILVSLRCPVELGCRTSYWQWHGTSTHDPGWIAAQVAAAQARFTVDPARIYAAGYSGGATYLGWYVPTFPREFAAVAHIAGGMPWGTPCPSCKVPVFFTLGAGDPMLVPYTRPLRDYYASCGGHEIAWQTLPGVTHEGIIPTVQAGKGKEILAWLLAHPAACEGPAIDAGIAAPVVDDRDAAAPVAAADPPDPPPRPVAPPPQIIAPRPSSCACELGAQRGDITPAVGLAWLMLAAASRRRRATVAR